MYKQGDQLYIRIESELSRSMLDKPDVRQTIADAAQKQWGEAVRVTVTNKDPAAEEKKQAASGFDEILSSGRDAGIKINLK